MTAQSTSAVPYVKAALVTLFTSTLATEGDGGKQLMVSYGWPKNIPREIVVVGEVVGTADQDWSALGARRRDEEFLLAVFVDVRNPELTQQAATERVYAVFGLLEDAVRANVNLDLMGSTAGKFRYIEVQVAQPALEEEPGDDGGFYARVLWALKIKARIGG